MLMQRILAILMLFVIPLQGLAVPHRHGTEGSAPNSHHDQTPHFHFGSSHHAHHSHGPATASSHHHDGVAHSHSESDTGLVSTSELASEDPLPDSSGSHDDDALYVSGLVALPATSSQLLLPDGSNFAHALAADLFRLVSAAAPQVLWRPPPCSLGLPVFLKTVSMLI